jgi:hypothetical protein
MPKFLESKLKKEYGAKSDIPYKVMNSLGVMHGNKETAKGRREEKKHNAKTLALKNKPKSNVRSKIKSNRTQKSDGGNDGRV